MRCISLNYRCRLFDVTCICMHSFVYIYNCITYKYIGTIITVYNTCQLCTSVSIYIIQSRCLSVLVTVTVR